MIDPSETVTPIRAIPERADAILDGCKAAFAQKGFDGASMQDLARSAGMSAGNFYRYFPSKDSIIEAIVARELAQIEALFGEIARSATPREAFLDVISAQMDAHANAVDGALWAEIESAANRRPAVGQILAQMETVVLNCQLRLFAQLAGIDDAMARTRFLSHARLILMLVRASAMLSCQTTPQLPQQEEKAFRALVIQNINLMLIEITSLDRTVS